jgi:hypothetical protein
VTIGYYSPDTEPDQYVARLYNDKGDLVKTLASHEGHEDWALFSALYDEAHRVVTGWDRALNDAEKALEAPGDVGEPQALTDDDIPF